MASRFEFCLVCRQDRIGLFCERCGHSHSGLAMASWSVVIAPDRGYFEAGGYADTFTFPAFAPRRVELTGVVLRIGRRSASQGITPEIDLTGPPADPGVSREHARLLAQPDGCWALVDEGSTNGTYLNDDATPITAHAQVPLTHGDRVHLGAWTTITLQRDS